MFQYALRRLLIAVPMLLGAMSIVFVAMRVLPGDPCVAMMGDQATSGALADCTRNLGLDRPLAVQYVDYLWRSVQFDFGKSFRQGYPVSDYIGRMFPHTFVLYGGTRITDADPWLSLFFESTEIPDPTTGNKGTNFAHYKGMDDLARTTSGPRAPRASASAWSSTSTPCAT